MLAILSLILAILGLILAILGLILAMLGLILAGGVTGTGPSVSRPKSIHFGREKKAVVPVTPVAILGLILAFWGLILAIFGFIFVILPFILVLLSLILAIFGTCFFMAVVVCCQGWDEAGIRLRLQKLR